MANVVETASNTSDKDITDLGKFQKWVTDSLMSVSESNWRTVALEDYKFYAGDQDTPEVIAALEQQNRPDTTYNEIKPKIDMLIGVAAQVRHDVEALPVGLEDAPLAELITNVMKHFRKTLKMSRKELECFEHTVKSGRSYLYFYIDTSNPFKPKICSTRLSGFDVFVDPNYTGYDLDGARFIGIQRWMTEDDLKDKWGIEAMEADGMPWSADMPDFWNQNDDLYRVVELWYWKPVPLVYFINPLTQQPESASPKDFNTFKNALLNGIKTGPNPEDVIQYVETIPTMKRNVKKMHYTIFTGSKLLEGGISTHNYHGYPIVQYGAYKNENLNHWFGAITMMKDPQRSVNTMRRQLSHLLQTLPKGILAHEVGAIINIEEYEERSADPSFHLEIASGKIDAFKFITQPPINPIYSQFDQVCSQGMKDASGIQNEMMGVQTTSREPGVSVRIRQETGLAVLMSLYENLKESRYTGNKILLAMIQQYVTQEMMIRVTGETGKELMAINSQMNPDMPGFNDISAGEFDLELEDRVETATTRAAIVQILTEYSQNNPGIIPPDIVMEYSDVPFTVKQRIKIAHEQQQQASKEAADREYELQSRELDLRDKEIELRYKADLAGHAVSHEKTVVDAEVKKEVSKRQHKAQKQQPKAKGK